MAKPEGPQPEILFVTGKGGVGKSVVAAALALRAAAAGRKTLLVEFGRQSFYERLLGLAPGSKTYPGQPDLQLERWEEDACLREYVGHYLPLQRAADFFLDNKIIRALVRAAPTLKELALIGKATGPHRLRWARSDRDLIVIDAFSTGHFVALLRAPRGIHEAIPAGPVGRQTGTILEVLKDPRKCRFVIVTLAQELPVSEALELHAAIAAETGQAARIVCNRLQPQLPEAEISHLAAAPNPGPAAAFAAHLGAVQAQQMQWLNKLRRVDKNTLQWPQLFIDKGDALITALARETGPL